jgi:hypothetical protein
MKAPRPTEEATEGTPVKKRGRRKSVVADQPLPAIDGPANSPAKKRGRPPKETAVVPLAEDDGPSVDVEDLQEEEEGPATKRIRIDDDTTMEDAIHEDETQGQTLEYGVPSMSEQTEATTPSHIIHRRSASNSIEPHPVGFPETSKAAPALPESPSRPDGRPRVTIDSPTSAERLDKGTQTKAVEKSLAEPPRSIFELLAGTRRTNKVQKTYGKRFKRL